MSHGKISVDRNISYRTITRHNDDDDDDDDDDDEDDNNNEFNISYLALKRILEVLVQFLVINVEKMWQNCTISRVMQLCGWA